MNRYLWFSAFAICGIAFYVWIETWAHYNREKLEELLEGSEKSRKPDCLCSRDESGLRFDIVCPRHDGEFIVDTTSWPSSITVPNDNGTSITHTN